MHYINTLRKKHLVFRESKLFFVIESTMARQNVCFRGVIDRIKIF